MDRKEQCQHIFQNHSSQNFRLQVFRGRYSSGYCLPHALICEVLYPSLFMRKKLKIKLKTMLINIHVFLKMKQDLNWTEKLAIWDGHYI